MVDWRAYIYNKVWTLGLFFLLFSGTASAQQIPDNELLGRALEYFKCGKYHESLLLFQQLDKRYQLNDRYKAYIGLCYYYDWDYKKAVKYFDKATPQLGLLAPHERSVYFYAAGESYFQLKNYPKALDYYNLVYPLCYNNERGDVRYRQGLCRMFMKQWAEAYRCYADADSLLRLYRDSNEEKARRAQIRNMMTGCKAYAEAEQRAHDADSLKRTVALADSLWRLRLHNRLTENRKPSTP